MRDTAVAPPLVPVRDAGDDDGSAAKCCRGVRGVRDRETTVAEGRAGAGDARPDPAYGHVESTRGRPQQPCGRRAAIDIAVEARGDGDRRLDQPARAKEPNRVRERHGQSAATEL